jgi:hypothetical protein
MNLYCDNYSTCNSYQMDQGSPHRTEERARARGWHLFHGTDNGGKPHDAVLCGQCVDDRRRKLNPAPPLQPGQQQLFEVVVYHNEKETA